ncbi:MAG: hypothetical protein AB7E37_00105 [Candidatus Altimarinota bacterium]
MGKNKGIPLIRIIIFVGAVLFFIISVIQFVFWYYPKNCIFFEFDFSKQCASNTWEYITTGNKQKVNKGVEEGINNYIDYRVEKAEKKAERLQESLKNINITQTGTTK